MGKMALQQDILRTVRTSLVNRCTNVPDFLGLLACFPCPIFSSSFVVFLSRATKGVGQGVAWHGRNAQVQLTRTTRYTAQHKMAPRNMIFLGIPRRMQQPGEIQPKKNKKKKFRIAKKKRKTRARDKTETCVTTGTFLTYKRDIQRNTGEEVQRAYRVGDRAEGGEQSFPCFFLSFSSRDDPFHFFSSSEKGENKRGRKK